jgi:hypothetical protein
MKLRQKSFPGHCAADPGAVRIALAVRHQSVLAEQQRATIQQAYLAARRPSSSTT